MKVEFLINPALNENDGRHIFIMDTEFRKAEKDDEEFGSFAFATNCFAALYGEPERFIDRDMYEKILKNLKKGGAVIIRMKEVKYPKRLYWDVYVSNNQQLKKVDF